MHVAAVSRAALVCIAHADQCFILSAAYGLLHSNEIVAPYDRALNRMRKSDRIRWAEHVERQLLAALPKDAEVLILAGIRYRDHVAPFLQSHGFLISIPLKGKSIGRQLQWLKMESAKNGNVS